MRSRSSQALSSRERDFISTVLDRVDPGGAADGPGQRFQAPPVHHRNKHGGKRGDTSSLTIRIPAHKLRTLATSQLQRSSTERSSLIPSGWSKKWKRKHGRDQGIVAATAVWNPMTLLWGSVEMVIVMVVMVVVMMMARPGLGTFTKDYDSN